VEPDEKEEAVVRYVYMRKVSERSKCRNELLNKRMAGYETHWDDMAVIG
jgi:hypothetical protein